MRTLFTFALALLALLPLTASAAAPVITNIAHFPSVSVHYTNYLAEGIVTNGLTLGGVRNTSWPAGGIAGSVSNNVASAGLLAVDSTKTNGIAATFAHVTNALGYFPLTNTAAAITNAWGIFTGDTTKAVSGAGTLVPIGGGTSYWATNVDGALIPSGVVQSNLFSISEDGSVLVGNVSTNFGPISKQINCIRIGDATGFWAQSAASDVSTAANSYFAARATMGSFTYETYAQTADAASWMKVDYNLDLDFPANAYWEFAGKITESNQDNDGRVVFTPFSTSDSNFYFQSPPRESGAIFRIGNSITNVATFEFDGALTTGGNTNQWKMAGITTNAISVSTNRYLTVTVDGVAYKLVTAE